MRIRFSVTRMPSAAMILLGAVALAAAQGCGKSDSVKTDLSTPRSAAMVFTRALENGDVETAKSAAYAGGVEVEWVEAMTGAMSGMRQLVGAAAEKFGAEDANALLDRKETLTLSAGLKDAEVKMDGSRATINPTNGGTQSPALPMKNVDGKWKLDVGTFTRGEDITMRVKVLRVVGEFAPKLAKDVEAGKFQTVKEVQRAMGLEILRVVHGVREPTTAPATVPVQAPQELPSDI